MNFQHFNSRLFISSSNNLISYDTATGDSHAVTIPAPNLPPNLTKGQLEVLNKEDRTINSMAISKTGQYIAVSTENKQVVIYDNSLNVKENFIVNRTASKLVFSPSDDVIVADRTGDVYLYKLGDKIHEPTLLLGHLSMILDVVFSECGKYIVSCDRDEKIRVSRFPNTYNIVSYCLGHEEFVIALKIVKNVLISASGDGTVRIWNYLKGEELSVVNTNHYISNNSLLETFSKEMDKEKVDITALPITDMQTYSDGTNLFIAVSVYMYKGIQLYQINLESYESTCLKTIEPVDVPHKFCLAANLYILDNFKLTTYKLTNNEYVQTCCSKLQEFYEQHKHVLKINDNTSITVLYKRKFDNVQEYLERKKMRLQSQQ